MINFSIINDWGSGFTGSLSIVNLESMAIDGWIIEFEAPFQITNIWNAKILSQEGNRYVIQSESWNSNIAPNQTISFGFNGNGSAVEPTDYRFNGMAIASPPEPAPVEPINPAIPTDSEMDHQMDNPNHSGEHQMDDHNHSGEHNHVEEPLPDNVNTDPLTEDGQLFISDGTNQRITNFDPAKDRVDIGPDSIHNQIPIDTPDGLVFQNMFNPNRALTLVGINLEDL
ncbi:MAG: hypothetical protein F6K30_29715, partial [Cyanothece sp. SIO2G6]|nr:hypothetical protein [Cyanothece sp. SIO2G6]